MAGEPGADPTLPDVHMSRLLILENHYLNPYFCHFWRFIVHIPCT